MERRYAVIGIDNDMKKYTIAFGSVNIAMKAQSVFRNQGYKTEVIRTPKNLSSGCGYSLVFYGDIEPAIEILERKGINFKSIMENFRPG